MVQPAAMAGATLAEIWFSGQFHGVIIPATPMPSFTTRLFPRAQENSYSSSVLIICLMCTSAVTVCILCANPACAPISRVSTAAMSS